MPNRPEFNASANQLIDELIAKLKQNGGTVEEYPLPKMGERRLALRSPDNTHPKGRGVFARFRPTRAGATVVGLKATGGARESVQLDNKTLNGLYKRINTRRAEVTDRPKISRKAAPNKAGTVSGGQFESKR